MKNYAFKARERTGKSVNGTIQAEDEKGLDSYFSENNLIPISVEETEETAEKTSPFANFGKKKVSDMELIAFTRQLAAAYGAGVSVSRALEVLAAQSSPQLREKLEVIRLRIEEGHGLRESFGEYPELFNRTYLSIVRSGEATGQLDKVMDFAAVLLERKMMFNEKLKSAFLYPKLVVGMIGITLIVIMTVVVPQFVQIFGKFKTELPLPTKILMLASNFFQGYWWAMILVAIGAWIGWKKLQQNEQFMIRFTKFQLKLPMIGHILAKVELANFCTTFSLLLKAGLDVKQTTEISVEGINNAYIRHEFGNIVPTIERGGTLSDALDGLPLIPPLLCAMLKVGEESGSIDELLARLARLYEAETDIALKKLPTLLEPVILSSLFAIVLFLAIAVYLPMWRMASFAKQKMP